MNWRLADDNLLIEINEAQLFKPFKIRFEHRDICVVKTEEGIFGISNKCPHAGAQLHFGHCNKKGVIGCPLHGYKFDIKTGRSADGNNYKLSTYHFKTEEDKLYIGTL